MLDSTAKNSKSFCLIHNLPFFLYSNVVFFNSIPLIYYGYYSSQSVAKALFVQHELFLPWWFNLCDIQYLLLSYFEWKFIVMINVLTAKSDNVWRCDRTLTFESEHLLEHPELGVNLSYFHDKEHWMPCHHLTNHLVCELLRFQVANHWLSNTTIIKNVNSCTCTYLTEEIQNYDFDFFLLIEIKCALYFFLNW